MKRITDKRLTIKPLTNVPLPLTLNEQLTAVQYAVTKEIKKTAGKARRLQKH